MVEDCTNIKNICSFRLPISNSEEPTYIHADLPRIQCEKHGVKTVQVPWAREGANEAVDKVRKMQGECLAEELQGSLVENDANLTEKQREEKETLRTIRNH